MDGRAPPAPVRILGVSLVIGFMALLDVTIVNVAIPSIRSVSTAPRWRYIFLVNVLIGLAAMVAVTRMVPKRAPRPAGEPRPGLLAALAVLAIALMMAVRAPGPGAHRGRGRGDLSARVSTTGQVVGAVALSACWSSLTRSGGRWPVDLV